MGILDLFQGFIIGSSLIIAIGPQNLFVINQGLKKKYILLVVLICSFSDSLLIITGIFISNILIEINSTIIFYLKILAGVWLILYGINKIRISRNIQIEEGFFESNTVWNAIITTLIITYINPHVYLDTVILIGSISINFDNHLLFGLGAIIASFVFFFSLGYLSKWLSKFIKSKKTWLYINLVMGLLMIGYGSYFILVK